MIPTCIAFEIKNDKIEIITMDTPYIAITSAMIHFKNSVGQISTLEDIRPPCPKINPENIIVKDVSHLTKENQLLLKTVKTVTELENLYKETKINKDLIFTKPELTKNANTALTTLQKKGTMHVKELIYIICPSLIDKL